MVYFGSTPSTVPVPPSTVLLLLIACSSALGGYSSSSLLSPRQDLRPLDQDHEEQPLPPKITQRMVELRSASTSSARMSTSNAAPACKPTPYHLPFSKLKNGGCAWPQICIGFRCVDPMLQLEGIEMVWHANGDTPVLVTEKTFSK